ncbi:MAG: 16S rRNA (adenine(1518)-N(6)/adenine(1519)-N(6))-dimethyltransferase RsmA [Candidatus Thorarchaeota archaeon]
MIALFDYDIKDLLRKYSVTPHKKSGQSFLTNERIARDIVAAANLSPHETVLEIGGGLGILTKWLSKSAGSVKVIEIESGLVSALRDIFSEVSNVEIIHGDALKIPLPKCNKIVSNLPYSISSVITFRLLKEGEFESAVLMYQKEFAERLVAEAGTRNYSRLTVDFQYQAEAESMFDVSAKQFYPIPAVDSTVVKLRKRVSGLFAKDSELFYLMIRGIYPYPNKQLGKALRIWFQNLGIGKGERRTLVEQVSKDIPMDVRLRNLDIKSLVYISDAILEIISEGLLPDPRGKTT